MAIILGNYTFDAARTAVIEKWDEVAGRDARIIQIKGIVDGLSSPELLETALDAILKVASECEEQTVLSLRPGRRLYVRRTGFSREIQRDAVVGTFGLTLEAQNPFEESETVVNVAWSITESGGSTLITAAGSAPALPVITLTAIGTIMEPGISDGTRQIVYPGMVTNGKSLVLDVSAGMATLDGLNVTPYTVGLFPRLAPGGTTLHYTDSMDSSHRATASIAYRDRWW